VWTLSIADEKLARVDARGDALAFVPEMAKRMIRAIDGNVVDWSTGAVNREQAVSAGTGASVATGRETHVPTFWEEIGPSFRQLVINHFHKTHTLDPEQAAYFFMRCYAVRSGRPG
jgi:hypothetical protein